MLGIVITGASRGIGMAAAVELARAGHSVVATMRDPGGSPELGELAAREGLPIRVETLDVDSDASVEACFSRVHASMAVEVLINNAGVERMGVTEETPLADYKQCMETNYFGAIRCIQAVLPRMRERGKGTIVNVTSVSGKISCSPMAPYAASKFALEAVSEALAQEVKPFGIRVVILQPGIIDTRMARNIETVPGSSLYPHPKRIGAMFAAVLGGGATGPESVALTIREIVEGDSGQLRHAAGASAVPFLQWRASMSDEQWVDWGAQDNANWTEAVKRDFGMDLKL